jgi:hypothetical protein
LQQLNLNDVFQYVSVIARVEGMTVTQHREDLSWKRGLHAQHGITRILTIPRVNRRYCGFESPISREMDEKVRLAAFFESTTYPNENLES